ncbi:MAG TPA: SGNH/GDSL hydrolase family protein [Bryobacteraceae bacterium]|nr:SGNH/GDSL hydrolase family protein [Bryobacteraceae bacterium]
MKIKPALLLLFEFAFAAAAAQGQHWVATWAASPSPQLADEAKIRADKLEFQNQTLREIVHTSIGGDTVRVRLSNAFGKTPVEIDAVHIAQRAEGSAIVSGSDRVLTFSGRPAVTIPSDAPVLSDPVKLTAPAAGDLAISIFLAKPAAGAGIHYSAQQTSYIGNGDLTGAVSMAQNATITSWVFLAGVDVLAPESAATVVAFGDSITDGARSTMDANHRWPDILAGRLLAQHGRRLGVVDAGIGGNRILHDASGNVEFGVNALARVDRDVLAQPGARYVIVLEGINDIGHAGTSAPDSETVSAADIIAGLKQIIERGHEHGLKVFGGTLTPFAGTIFPGYYTPEKDIKRKAVNEWIRTSHAFDGVIDFDKAIRDPSNPDRMLPAYDGGDHLHPSDAGYKAMADAIELSLFR